MDEENRRDRARPLRKNKLITQFTIIKIFILSTPLLILCISLDSKSNKGIEKTIKTIDEITLYNEEFIFFKEFDYV